MLLFSLPLSCTFLIKLLAILRFSRGVPGRLVKVDDLEALAPHCCVLQSHQGLCILSCEEAIQLA